MKGIEEADLKCRKLNMGNVPFSAKYKELTNKIELWKAVVTKKRHCKFSQGKLRRLEKSTGTPNSLHCSLQDAQNRLKIAFDEYWKLKKNARIERNTFMEEKAQAIAKELGTEKAIIIKQIITREKQREAVRQIKYTLHKF
jgi:predicted transposase YbfD/YdcC